MKNLFIANIIIKVKTALKVASGKQDLLQDSPIQKDWNGLPMILGTSFAGVLRKEFDKDLADELFGDDCSEIQDKIEKKECIHNAKGSRIIISNALLLDEKQKVNESLLLEKSDFLKEFDILAKREHTAISHEGVAVHNSKYNEEVVYAGSKFKFSISLLNEDENSKEFFKVLDLLSSNSFRIGAGSSKGFGQIEVENIKYELFDMSSEKFASYKNSLNSSLSQEHEINKSQNDKYDIYKIKLKPDNFFMFGSGFGDGEANMTPIYEKQVNEQNNGFTKKKVLIPASSIKGALSHRTTFHYHKILGVHTQNLKEKVDSVEEIFGNKKDNQKDDSKGKILISDAYLEENQTKIFDHVAIDRFTSGAIDSVLFQEKTVTSNEKINLEILLEKDIEQNAIDAFEKALIDLKRGMLSLGGATTKGHGIFTGEIFKNGSKL